MISKLTLDRFEGDKAVLIGNNNMAIVWPKDKLLSNLHEGSVLSFNIMEEKEQEKQDREKAKDIINKILRIYE